MEQTAKTLGYAGVLPFLLMAIGIWLFEAAGVEWMLDAFRVWSAVMLSFLGALWWGLLLAHPQKIAEARQGSILMTGAMPVLVAAIALLLAPVVGLLVAVSGYAVFRWLETLPSHRDFYPRWFDQLRARLSWMVVVCHVSMVTWAVSGYHT